MLTCAFPAPGTPQARREPPLSERLEEKLRPARHGTNGQGPEAKTARRIEGGDTVQERLTSRARREGLSLLGGNRLRCKGKHFQCD